MLVTTALKYHWDHEGRKRRAGGTVVLSSPLQCLGCLDLPGKKKKKPQNKPPKKPQTFYSLPQTAFNFLFAQLYLYGCGAVHPTAPFRSSSLPFPSLPSRLCGGNPRRTPPFSSAGPGSKQGIPECIPAH